MADPSRPSTGLAGRAGVSTDANERHCVSSPPISRKRIRNPVSNDPGLASVVPVPVWTAHQAAAATARAFRSLHGLRSSALAAITAVMVVTCLAGCSSLRESAERAATPSATPARTTGPPPGASQAPGPPLATASVGEAAGPSGSPPDPTDPAAVAAYCFARWQSFDARTDASFSAGVDRAQADSCFTTDFLAQLSGTGSGSGDAGSSGEDGQAWQEQRDQGARSTVTVLAATPLADTAATGRVVYLLNTRSAFTTDNATPVETVSTPTVTLLRDTTGRWQIAGADLSDKAGDAPGR